MLDLSASDAYIVLCSGMIKEKGIYDRKRAFKYTDYWEMKHKPCMFNESKFYMVQQKQLNRVLVGLRGRMARINTVT